MNRSIVWLVCLAVLNTGAPLAAQQAEATQVGADSVRIFLRQVELRTALEVLGKYLDKPVMVGPVGDAMIELFETPRPIHVSQVRAVLQGVVEAHGLRIVEDDAMIRVLQTEDPGGAAADPDEPQEAPAQQLDVRLFTIRLQHALAEDVAAVLNQLFGAGDPLAAPGGAAAPAPTNPRGLLPQEAPSTGRLMGEVVVVPDVPTNSLLVRASEVDYDILLNAVQELDIRPLQVLIEVIIVEARKDRRFEVGISAHLESAKLGDGQIGFDVDNQTLGDLVVQVMNLGPGELGAVLTAARSRGDAEILSRPVLVAANNTEANLLVGTEQPFVQVSRSLPTDTPQRDQVVQYREVGTELTVIPTINQDGYVMLEILQEMSQVTGETQFDAPVISSRHASTRLLVRDAQTVVIGGLTDSVVDKIRTGVPLLSDIPLLGGLFGATRNRTTETELFLFITPTILYDDAGADLETLRRLPEHLRGLVPGGEIGGAPPPRTAPVGPSLVGPDTLVIPRVGGGG